MRVFYWVIMLVLFKASTAFAQSENSVKASYVFNFIKFVNWPQQVWNSDKFNLCAIGEGEVVDRLSKLQGKRVRNKTIQFKQVEKANGDCHLLYFSPQEQHFLSQHLSNIKYRPVLTVSSVSDFVDKGGMIELFRLGNVVKFNINLDASSSVNLRLSAKLSELAVKVVKQK